MNNSLLWRRKVVATSAVVALMSCLSVPVLSAEGIDAGTDPQVLSNGALARMPVKEVTVFKDGHAFLLHEGRLPTNGQGNVVLDSLPNPVLGTFWPYSNDTRASLTSVVASATKVEVERTALAIRDLLEANVGKTVVITEADNKKYEATVLAVPQRSEDEMERLRAAASPTPQYSYSYSSVVAPDALQKGNVVLLKNADGVRVLPVERIQDVTFKGTPELKSRSIERRNLLTL